MIARAAVAALLLCAAASAAAETRVVMPPPENERDLRARHVTSMTQAALDRTAEFFGPGRVVLAEAVANRARTERDLATGMLTAAVLPASVTRDRAYWPIRYPMHLGLLGLRVSLITREQAARFAEIRTLGDLRTVTVGIGEGWGVGEVFSQNDLPMVVSSSYTALFRMLAAGRFDHFSRGVTEIRAELATWAPHLPSLAIEETFLMQAPFAMFLYVTPGEDELAQRLRRGFRALFEDGTFQRSVAEAYGDDIRALRLKDRAVIALDAPAVAADWPVDPIGFIAGVGDLAVY